MTDDNTEAADDMPADPFGAGEFADIDVDHVNDDGCPKCWALSLGIDQRLMGALLNGGMAAGYMAARTVLTMMDQPEAAEVLRRVIPIPDSGAFYAALAVARATLTEPASPDVAEREAEQR